ncbi:MAG: GldG family protein [Salinisphaera sp.]|jgi:hypothetical protein|nr:GldG family protein [Salinisphaera sp.]
MRLTHVISMLLIGVVAVLAGAASQRYSISADWTQGNRNSLTHASQRVLAALDAGPIRLTAYIYPGPQRAEVRQQLARYTRASSRVSLNFVDPAQKPTVVRHLGIGRDGAVVLHYQGRSQAVTDYSETSVTNALQRLSTAGNAWIVFVTGHGERAVDDKATAGYSKLASALNAQGLTVRPINLIAAGAIPDNTGVLVIASPQKNYLPGEIAMIRAYIANGGNVLWADDPGPRYGLAPVAQALGIHWLAGTLVYRDYRKLGTGNPAIALVANYPDTPITDHLKELTLFPFAGGLAALSNTDWQHQVFLRSGTQSWLETGSLTGSSITFQPQSGDRAGPVDFGMALHRTSPKANHGKTTTGDSRPRAQRVVAVADSDFMDNGHIGDLGNRTLALSIFQWLAHRDAQIAVNVAKAPDDHLQMAPARLTLFWWIFVAGIPLTLLASGLGRWWLRRRR